MISEASTGATTTVVFHCGSQTIHGITCSFELLGWLKLVGFPVRKPERARSPSPRMNSQIMGRILGGKNYFLDPRMLGLGKIEG